MSYRALLRKAVPLCSSRIVGFGGALWLSISSGDITALRAAAVIGALFPPKPPFQKATVPFRPRSLSQRPLEARQRPRLSGRAFLRFTGSRRGGGLSGQRYTESDMTLVLGISLLVSASSVGVSLQEKVAFKFFGSEYVHRYTKGDLHEYTPKGAPSLDKWTDMVTLNVYRNVKDGEGLSKAANGVLETYKGNKAMIVRTDSKAKTQKQEAEHLIVALFGRPDYIEAAFARFCLKGGQGCSVVYSHRVYGKKAGDAMSAWLKKNGPGIEKELMGMAVPAAPK